jgi:hypothetical protein
MSASDFFIKNCTSNKPGCACPAAWSRLESSFSDAVRHCSQCNRKVYLCLTDQDIKFYSSLKYPIAIGGPEAEAALARLPQPEAMAASAASEAIEAIEEKLLVNQKPTPATPAAPAEPAAPGVAANSVPRVWRRSAATPVPADSAASERDADDLPDMPAFMHMRLQFK